MRSLWRRTSRPRLRRLRLRVFHFYAPQQRNEIIVSSVGVSLFSLFGGECCFAIVYVASSSRCVFSHSFSLTSFLFFVRHKSFHGLYGCDYGSWLKTKSNGQRTYYVKKCYFSALYVGFHRMLGCLCKCFRFQFVIIGCSFVNCGCCELLSRFYPINSFELRLFGILIGWISEKISAKNLEEANIFVADLCKQNFVTLRMYLSIYSF